MTSTYLYDGANIAEETGTGTTYLSAGIDQMLAMESGSGGTAQVDSYLTDALGSTIRNRERTLRNTSRIMHAH